MHQVRDAIPDDLHHVAIVSDIACIHEATVAGNYHRPALRPKFRDRQVEDKIQSREQALIRAALRRVDHRIPKSDSEYRPRQSRRRAEVHHAVAIRVRIRLIQHFDAFTIEELAEFVLGDMECIGRPLRGVDHR